MIFQDMIRNVEDKNLWIDQDLFMIIMTICGPGFNYLASNANPMQRSYPNKTSCLPSFLRLSGLISSGPSPELSMTKTPVSLWREAI